ncbi:MAG: carbonic anhydrase [Patescibacteria group bacterium]
MINKHADGIRTGCQVTLVDCTTHGALGASFAWFRAEHGLDPHGSFDLVSQPGGVHAMRANEPARRNLRETLQLSVDLHSPEVIVFADHPHCPHGRYSAQDRTREYEYAKCMVQDWFPKANLLRYFVADTVHRKVASGNNMVWGCMDWRNSRMFEDFFNEGCDIFTAAGDFDRLANSASPEDQVQHIRYATDSVDAQKPGTVTLLGHLGCGWRGQKYGITDTTSESDQRNLLLETGLQVIERLRPHLPHHRFELACSLTRGHALSSGIEILLERDPMVPLP